MQTHMTVPVLRILAEGDIRLEEFRAYLAAIEHAHNSYLVFEQVVDSVHVRAGLDDTRPEQSSDVHWPATQEGIAARVPESCRLRLRRVRFESPGFIEIFALVASTISSLVAIYVFIEAEIRKGEHGRTMRRLNEELLQARIRTEELNADLLATRIEQAKQEHARKMAFLQSAALPMHTARQLEMELVEWPKQIIGSHIQRGTITGAELIFPDFDMESSPSGAELVRIPGGSFLMGLPEDEAGRWGDESPCHEVQVSDFYLARYPVTNAQYGRFLEANPGVAKPAYWEDQNFNQPKQPVVGVDWNDARAYCDWAGLRLPSEAEWEYACRAGTKTRYWSGDEEADLGRVGWYSGNSDSRLHPVGEKEPNPYGLYDMHGNVWEWVEDDWHGDYKGAPVDGSAWVGKQRAEYRVRRGGAWDIVAGLCRSTCRSNWYPGGRRGSLGFRPARSIP